MPSERMLASAFSDLHRAVDGLRGADVAASGPGSARLEGDFARMVLASDRIAARAASVDLDAETIEAVQSYAEAGSEPRVLSFSTATAFSSFERRVEALVASTAQRVVRRATSFLEDARAVVDGPRGADLLGSFVRFAAVAGVAATLNVAVGDTAEAGVFSFFSSSSTDVSSVHTGPSGAMLDLSSDVLAANLGGMEGALGILENADMVVRRCALGDAPRGETGCVVRRAGIVFDYNAGRYEAWLLPVEGFSEEPKLVVVEEEGAMRIVDEHAYSLVRQESLNATASHSGADEAPEM